MSAIKTPTLTWDKLVQLEPRLQPLLDEAKAVDGRGKQFCANAVWYGYAGGGRNGIKARLCELIGYDRPGIGDTDAERVLSGGLAYDIAYETIYDALPDCRQCGCF